MEILKKLFGITKLEKQIQQNKTEINKLKKPKSETHKQQVLQILKTPTSTNQLAKKLKISRSRTSTLLNQLEKQNKIYEHSKSGKSILYKIR
jgi:predicted Rossmann fold nucleotide-binding protein DprA/Smf involved in DNA uptake